MKENVVEPANQRRLELTYPEGNSDNKIVQIRLKP